MEESILVEIVLLLIILINQIWMVSLVFNQNLNNLLNIRSKRLIQFFTSITNIGFCIYGMIILIISNYFENFILIIGFLYIAILILYINVFLVNKQFRTSKKSTQIQHRKIPKKEAKKVTHKKVLREDDIPKKDFYERHLEIPPDLQKLIKDTTKNKNER